VAKIATLRALSEQDMQQRLKDLREEQFNLRFRNVMKQLENPLRIRDVRREIAQIETLLTGNRSTANRPAAGRRSS